MAPNDLCLLVFMPLYIPLPLNIGWPSDWLLTNRMQQRSCHVTSMVSSYKIATFLLLAQSLCFLLGLVSPSPRMSLLKSKEFDLFVHWVPQDSDPHTVAVHILGTQSQRGPAQPWSLGLSGPGAHPPKTSGTQFCFLTLGWGHRFIQ